MPAAAPCRRNRFSQLRKRRPKLSPRQRLFRSLGSVSAGPRRSGQAVPDRDRTGSGAPAARPRGSSQVPTQVLPPAGKKAEMNHAPAIRPSDAESRFQIRLRESEHSGPAADGTGRWCRPGFTANLVFSRRNLETPGRLEGSEGPDPPGPKSLLNPAPTGSEPAPEPVFPSRRWNQTRSREFHFQVGPRPGQRFSPAQRAYFKHLTCSQKQPAPLPRERRAARRRRPTQTRTTNKRSRVATTDASPETRQLRVAVRPSGGVCVHCGRSKMCVCRGPEPQTCWSLLTC